MRISIVNGSIEFDGETLLSEINFEINDKEKIAIVGRNGCGKTSLLRALTNELELIKGVGEENFGFYTTGKPRLGYLNQVSFNGSTGTLYQEMLLAYPDVIATEKDMEDALNLLQSNSTDEKRISRYALLRERYEALGGYVYKNECKVALNKFGFTESEQNRSISEFSGGQKTKIALLKLLLSRPDILILDEPTNHLDVEAVAWLEEYLINYKGAMIIVSHDRMFLDKIVNVVYVIEYGEMTRYKGNYTAFSEQKRMNYEKQLKDATSKAKEIARLQKIVDRFRYKATKASMAQSKLMQIKRIGDVNMPNAYDLRSFGSNFQPEYESVRRTLVVNNLKFGYNTVLGEVSFVLEKGQKLGIVGANGCGKSTLLKTLVGTQKSLGGEIVFGLHSKVGYFDQTLTQSYSEKTVFDDFHDDFPNLTDTEVRTALGGFLITGEDVFKLVKELSGGEKVRLALAKILKRRPNILILDEPTNHVDIVGKETIERLLTNYTGTIIVVSHDRYLINKVCDKILAFNENGIEFFDGKYADYENNHINKKVQNEQKAREEKITKPKKINVEREKGILTKKLNIIEKRIASYEEEIAVIDEKMNEEGICSDYLAIMQLEEEKVLKESEMEKLMNEWEEISLKIEDLLKFALENQN